MGIAAAAASLVAGVVLAFLASWETDSAPNRWLVLGLVVVAVSAPLYGAVAAAHGPRWFPLVVGLALGAMSLLWLFTLADVPVEPPG